MKMTYAYGKCEGSGGGRRAPSLNCCMPVAVFTRAPPVGQGVGPAPRRQEKQDETHPLSLAAAGDHKDGRDRATVGRRAKKEALRSEQAR